MPAPIPSHRIVNRVYGAKRLGPDSQVDDKAVVVQPGDFRRLDPFLAMTEDWFSEPGFDWHPHRGIETVTLVLDGALEHGDNRGSAGVLEPGDVQWMTAGSGIIHRELAFRNEHAHTLQLWVNLPRSHKLTNPRYQDLRAADRPVSSTPGARVEVIAGRSGDVTGPASTHWPITALLITLEPGASLGQRLPPRDRAFVDVLSGRVSVSGRALSTGQIGWSDPVRGPESRLDLRAPSDSDTPARLLLFAGQPIGEPVAAGGPFVMNTRAEIDKAWRDFDNGRFGPVPRLARRKHR